MARAEGVEWLSHMSTWVGRCSGLECSLDDATVLAGTFVPSVGAEMHWSLREVEKDWEATPASLEKALVGE